ncbi:MAG: efflux RND transporter permease subunit [Phycisphaerae bacterium]|nr:efflux RND transporter permease subunit [Phycisphaerae bacterium]
MIEEQETKGVVAWFASNHVAANLLMIVILIGGVISLLTINKEIFPETEIDMITISVPYLGASPSEVETGVILRIEEAVAGIEGIKKIAANANEGSAMVSLELEDFADKAKTLDDVKAAVDRIITFPQETEKPITAEVTIRREVLTMSLYGDADEKTLKNMAELIRDDLTTLDEISQVDISGIRDYEISIEVSEEKLRRYNLTFDDVSNAVRRTSLDTPGGSVKTIGGEILIRTQGQMYTGKEFEDIVVVARADGTNIFLSQIADVKDDFKDTDIATRIDGKPAVNITVYRVGSQDALDVADAAKQYLQENKDNLPAGLEISITKDRSDILKSRISLLTRNGRMGLVLVFITLALFLDLKLAFWTTMGIPISFMGALMIMPTMDVTINMITLFGFILSLGIVVDDAIVVGENIFEYQQKGMTRLAASIKGAQEMTWPVIIAVLTTVAAFASLLHISGFMGRLIAAVPIIVISVLAFSLLESLLILPAHLAAGGKVWRNGKHKRGPIGRFQDSIGKGLKWFVDGIFARFVEFAVNWRYITLAIGIVMMLLTLGLYQAGLIKWEMMPKVEADNVTATLKMPEGTSVQQTAAMIDRIENAAFELEKELEKERGPGKLPLYRFVITTLGSAQTGGGPGGPQYTGSSNIGQVKLELLDGENRDVSSMDVSSRWRQKVGELPGITSLSFKSELIRAGDAISIEMSHKDFDQLLEASEKLKLELAKFDGVFDIDDSFDPGKKELKLSLTEKGRLLGLTLSEVGRQVRQGFYGDQAQRIQRGRNDIRVMVRYPKDERISTADIENMRIRMPDGRELPFLDVANIKEGQGYSTIRRIDRRRVVTVTADVDVKSNANAEEINQKIDAEIFPVLKQTYPGLDRRPSGEQKEQKETKASMAVNALISLLLIYALLAALFSSYIQPVIIMSAIPFGIIGAVAGHMMMGYNISMLSMFGMVALTGVVVNDSLIMIDLINRERAEGICLKQVINDSATRRFRPIMLTTLTTFFGLMPMMFEKSIQAKFLIPMAISLGFGIVFATAITLLLVPSLYMIVEDVKKAFNAVFF